MVSRISRTGKATPSGETVPPWDPAFTRFDTALPKAKLHAGQRRIPIGHYADVIVAMRCAPV